MRSTAASNSNANFKALDYTNTDSTNKYTNTKKNRMCSIASQFKCYFSR